MEGPMPNFTPGYRASNASAIKWAEECQKVLLASGSFQVSSCKLESSIIGRLASQTWPLTLAARTFRAKPSLILSAISNPVLPCAYSFTEPSGRVILICCDMWYFFTAYTTGR